MDSRDLIERREELKQQILDAFNEQFDLELEEVDFTVVDNAEEFILQWADELREIEEIDELENEVSSNEWECGMYFIEEDKFEDYCEQDLIDCGWISKDMPYLIRNNIDWEGIADDMRQDYSEVEFQGKNYLYRD